MAKRGQAEDLERGDSYYNLLRLPILLRKAASQSYTQSYAMSCTRQGCGKDCTFLGDYCCYKCAEGFQGHGATCCSCFEANRSIRIETCANNDCVLMPTSVTYPTIGPQNSGDDASHNIQDGHAPGGPNAVQHATIGGDSKKRKIATEIITEKGGGAIVSSWGCKQGTLGGAGPPSDLPQAPLPGSEPPRDPPETDELWLALLHVIPPLKDECITQYCSMPAPDDYLAHCQQNGTRNVFFSDALSEVLDVLDFSGARAAGEVAIRCVQRLPSDAIMDKWVGRYVGTHALDFGPGPCCGRHFAQHFTTVACLKSILKHGLRGTRSLSRGANQVTNEHVVWCSRSDAMMHRGTWTLLSSVPWFVQCTVVTEVGGPYSNMQNLAVVPPEGGMKVKAVKLVFQPYPKMPQDAIVATLNTPRTIPVNADLFRSLRSLSHGTITVVNNADLSDLSTVSTPSDEDSSEPQEPPAGQPR